MDSRNGSCRGSFICFFVSRNPLAAELLQIRNKEVTSICHLELGVNTNFQRKLAVTDRDFWVAVSSRAIYRISRKDGAITHYALPGKDRQLEGMEVSANQDVWITTKSVRSFYALSRYSDAVYLWDHKTDSIISNLLSNAIKFSREKGRIDLYLGEEDGRLLLRVTDQGIGVPPHQLLHIFERFYQADDSAVHGGGGTGVGLTLTKELVELMDGKISVQSPGEYPRRHHQRRDDAGKGRLLSLPNLEK